MKKTCGRISSSFSLPALIQRKAEESNPRPEAPSAFEAAVAPSATTPSEVIAFFPRSRARTLRLAGPLASAVSSTARNKKPGDPSGSPGSCVLRAGCSPPSTRTRSGRSLDRSMNSRSWKSEDAYVAGNYIAGFPQGNKRIRLPPGEGLPSFSGAANLLPRHRLSSIV